jgi:hypothetical protein
VRNPTCLTNAQLNSASNTSCFFLLLQQKKMMHGTTYPIQFGHPVYSFPLTGIQALACNVWKSLERLALLP